MSGTLHIRELQIQSIRRIMCGDTLIGVAKSSYRWRRRESETISDIVGVPDGRPSMIFYLTMVSCFNIPTFLPFVVTFGKRRGQ